MRSPLPVLRACLAFTDVDGLLAEVERMRCPAPRPDGAKGAPET